MFRRHVAAFGAIVALAGCANADGSIGRPGSPIWFSSAKPEAIDKFLDERSIVALCEGWTRYELNDNLAGKRKYQEAVGRQLIKRGESPLACVAGANQARMRRDIEDAKREAARARREAEAARWEAYRAMQESAPARCRTVSGQPC